jgi:hypothetical protein
LIELAKCTFFDVSGQFLNVAIHGIVNNVNGRLIHFKKESLNNNTLNISSPFKEIQKILF